jgi:hypothetical protein
VISGTFNDDDPIAEEKIQQAKKVKTKNNVNLQENL